MALTDIAIKNAKPGDKPIKKADSAGLFLLITPAGGKLWRFKYRVAGKEKLLALGAYPEITLAEARKRRDDAREMLAMGKDPSREKQRDKTRAKLEADNTFASITAEYCKKRRRDGAKAWAPATAVRSEYLLSLLNPALGAMAVADIEPADVLGAIRKIEAKGNLESARRTLQLASAVFRYLSSYIERDLIPRIHGFELLMASYAMCHMKLDMILTQLGYKPSPTPPRLGVYLTNSLEGGERVRQTFDFGIQRAIAEEAKQANNIKRQTPIMCVIGNPPYSGESANKGDWIMGLMEAYKKEPGGKQKLQERNPKWINDDYVKFIRLAEHMIAKTGEGVLGFITNHGYLDNPTFRGMRWQLMNSFDRIHVLDLHGNSKKKEVCPDGSPDKNVFDIMQGVAIIIAVKHKRDGKEPKKLADVYHGELWGNREAKGEALWAQSLPSLSGTALPYKAPSYPFVARDYDVEAEYAKGFSVAELMPVNSVGIVTARDELTIDMDREALWARVQDFTQTDPETLRTRYDLGKDVRDWTVAGAKADVITNLSPSRLVPIAYRPFDTRWTFYTGHSRGFQCYPRNEVMQHFLAGNNLAVMTPRQAIQGGGSYSHVVAIQNIVDNRYVFSNKGIAQQFPLYLYPEEGTLDQTIRVNFDPKLYASIRKAAGLTGPLIAPDGTDAFRRATGDARPDEVKVFDYIYGVLHCPAYRETYAEFLKIDFPRIPFPTSPEQFADISAKGEALRRLHLMEDAAIGPTPYPFNGEGDSTVDKARYGEGRVWINAGQYFDGVPPQAWDFHIGGYQPAQKWLKDRKGRALSWDDIRHYQKIIKIMTETGCIMETIDLGNATSG